MQFASYAILLASLCCAAFSSDATFDQISKPSKGEVLQAGTMYNIKWHCTQSGDALLQLMSHKSSEYSDDALAVIAPIIDGTLGHHSWNVTDGLPNNETYYIEISLVGDTSSFSYSPGFRIHSNSSASATATPSATVTVYPSTTLSATASGATNATESTSTASTGGSAAASVAPVPLAFVGAAAIGMLVF
ncbi:hypothetical protein N7486_008047 [Penicillium sp. IBT 16267x]|nr:hypothetical protein N7486_008047 [Penicillium sp. IBT 16267x]